MGDFKLMKPIVTRYQNNPILTKDDVPYPVSTIYNAGVVKHEGRYVMLFRSNLKNGRSIIGKAESHNGFDFVVDSEPFLIPSNHKKFGEYEEFGVEDLRINPFGNEYLLTYSAYSRHGVRIALARTSDFVHVERISMISQADMRNVVIFPEKIGGLFVRLDRPHSEISPWSTWISYSPDLIYWGESKVLFKPVHYHWDEMKVGPGVPPFKTAKGWLQIFHGVYQTMSGSVYRLGVALHDLKDPSQLLGLSDSWILEPEDPWERQGYVPNVVFSCGAVPEIDGTLKIYWGGADTVMCVGTASIDELVDLCLTNSRLPL